MLKIIDKNIYTEQGKFLKKIECPKRVTLRDLKQKKDNKLYCKNCERNIIDTNYISEENLISLLIKDKETCLKISLSNPMFGLVK